MSLAFENKKVKIYFRLLKNWDIKSKKDLIRKLSKSISETAEDKHDFSACFGAWEDKRSADEIIEDIRGSQVNNREIEDF